MFPAFQVQIIKQKANGKQDAYIKFCTSVEIARQFIADDISESKKNNDTITLATISENFQPTIKII